MELKWKGDSFELNNRYQEILNLDKMLTQLNIPHELKRNFDGWQVCYPASAPTFRILSAIEHYGSYGKEQDLIEIMGLLTDEERKYDSVCGYLTASNVLERIKKHWEEVANPETVDQICSEYREAKFPDKQIKISSELHAIPPNAIIAILESKGFKPRKREKKNDSKRREKST